MGLILLLLSNALHASESLDVLHWWTSLSERRAADFLRTKLAEENIEWRDAAIPGGAGIGAVKVLKSRVLSGNPPSVAQLIGPAVSEWAELGLILELDNAAGRWQSQMFPTVWQLVTHRQHTVAVPLGIHRINTLFYNKKVFDRMGLAPPSNFTEFKRIALQLQAAGITPLAQSHEAWQVATLFETLVLAESDVKFYRDLFVARNPQAYLDPRFAQALTRLRQLRSYTVKTGPELSWTDVSRQFASGNAAMVIMGDWMKGELAAQGLSVDVDFACATVPNTDNTHLYSIDTMVMFAGDYSRQLNQERFAQIIVSPTAQLGYSKLKGSVPVRKDVDIASLDSCGRNSWRTFARGATYQAPSLVHRMATDDTFKDAIVKQIQVFYLDEKISVAETQQRLAAMVRALNRKED
ncbi:extracellular solute-binding protein [Deefgea chitinilytica]|uniref:Probable sugar-binding periplasmic protein n=1 Tax=Deefgea chitinilytica TaxID=570276 RepID=A0ABS2C7X2_9NEIS|nr:extracellular solute-binding protein [Deefgea chitinilytica]MBM9887376.1 carbohydrate ABC transporter substrate-binding protein [Deefgea sp. CFH1-16]